MSLDYAALTVELSAGHPVTGAYDADAQTAADQINAVNVDVPRDSMSGDEIFAATDPAEFAALTATNQRDQQALWLSFCGRSEVDPFGAANVAFVQSIFGTGSATVAALVAARQRQISRAEQLGFPAITITMVQKARGEI